MNRWRGHTGSLVWFAHSYQVMGRKEDGMSKMGLLVLCGLALLSGLGWVVLAGLPLVYVLGVVVICVGLGLCSLVVGK
jgi:hypothetical protein